MDRKLITFTLSLLIFLSCSILPASALQLSPNWLTDLTGEITPATKLIINELSQKYQRDNSLALYTAVVSNTENGLDDHRYIQQIFADNQLKERDTLILLDIGTRHVEMLSGEQSRIYDSNVQTAIAAAKPYLAANNWNTGAFKLVEAIASTPEANTAYILWFFAIVFLFLIVSSLIDTKYGSSSTSSSSNSYYSGGDSGSGGGSGGDSF